ncbi:MAG TPA: sterol desaturase family protein [Saprospiraceae bacterium]|nr:sterol desaturase family protein [Saprospiraceae bacterium]HNT20939.1 sterol desaturase family protein [Saprospiraceae bacterium]
METYGKILLVAMPAFLILVLFEKWYGWKKGMDTVRTMDMISSLSSGVTNVVKDVLGLSVGIISYGWMVDHLAVVHVQNSLLIYMIAFLALDFSGYWVHRIAHEYNFFWNNHIIHHSSEEFNLACALRQSISVFVRLFTFFLLPAALLGVPGEVIAVVAPLHLFAQFWYHTRHIGKMGFLEKIIVTPSHHRVHHAINPEYLDKNYSQIFIWWDKWFGTYQPELDHIPPVYGITRPVHTWNPIKINFQHLWLLIRDAWQTASWKDKLRIWIMPTGWRPADVAAKHEVYKIGDVYHFEKYETRASGALQVWTLIQLVVLLLLTSYLFGNIAAINKLNPWHIYLYGLFLFVFVYAFTELMDRNPRAWIPEGIKTILGGYFLISQGDWFLASSLWPMIPGTLAIYLGVSFWITVYFVRRHKLEAGG